MRISKFFIFIGKKPNPFFPIIDPSKILTLLPIKEFLIITLLPIIQFLPILTLFHNCIMTNNRIFSNFNIFSK